MSSTTTVTVCRETRDRLSQVSVNGQAPRSADEAVRILLDAYDRAKFWEEIDAIDPDEYRAHADAEGFWPSENAYETEEQLIRSQEASS